MLSHPDVLQIIGEIIFIDLYPDMSRKKNHIKQQTFQKIGQAFLESLSNSKKMRLSAPVANEIARLLAHELAFEQNEHGLEIAKLILLGDQNAINEVAQGVGEAVSQHFKHFFRPVKNCSLPAILTNQTSTQCLLLQFANRNLEEESRLLASLFTIAKILVYTIKHFNPKSTLILTYQQLFQHLIEITNPHPPLEKNAPLPSQKQIELHDIIPKLVQLLQLAYDSIKKVEHKLYEPVTLEKTLQPLMALPLLPASFEHIAISDNPCFGKLYRQYQTRYFREASLDTSHEVKKYQP